MATYITLVNELLRRLNEVTINVSDFDSVRNVQATAKDAINSAVREILQEAQEWPFTLVTYNQVLTAGVGSYDFPDNYSKADWETFYLKPFEGSEPAVLPAVTYEMYLRTARLDLDNYNNDTEDGCHITSMAGTWLSIVEGFAGMRVIDGMLSFRPFVPDQWNNFSFKINFRGTLLHITLSDESFTIFNDGSDDLDFLLLNDVVSVAAHQESVFNIS